MKTIPFSTFIEEINRSAAILVDNESVAFAHIIDDTSEKYPLLFETQYGEERFNEQEVSVLDTGEFTLINHRGEKTLIMPLIAAPFTSDNF